MESSGANPPPPQIENIEILELIGTGGMSLVYKARQQNLDRIVAVKVLSMFSSAGELSIKRFQQEARLTSTLEHPNIVKTLSFGISQDGQPYLVLEFLEGSTLQDELKLHGRLPLRQFRNVFMASLSALSQAHREGIIHRDLKPGNIMICKSDSGAESIKLVDFGIAKASSEEGGGHQNLTKTGALIGTPAYMSPEQCQGKPLDGRSDLYSIACIMYESLVGEPPFIGDSSLDLMQRQSSQAPLTVAELCRKVDIQKELAGVILWALAKEPSKRPQTADEFAAKLNSALERITLDKVPKLKSATNYSLMPSVMLCLLVLSIATVGTILYSRKKTPVPTPFAAQISPGHEQADDQRLERDYNTLWKRAERRAGPDHPKFQKDLDSLVISLSRRKQFTKIEALDKHILAIRENSLGPNNLLLARTLFDLSRCYLEQEKYTEAEEGFRRCLKIREDQLGHKSIEVALTIKYLADSIFTDPHRSEEYLKLKKEALLINESILGQDSLDLANSMIDLAAAYQMQRKYPQAISLYERAVAVKEKGKQTPAIFGQFERKESSPSDLDKVAWLWDYENLADCYCRQGAYAKAAIYYQKALSLSEGGAIDSYSQLAPIDGLINCYHHFPNKSPLLDPLVKRAALIRSKNTP